MTTIVAGIAMPSSSHYFLAAVGIHVAASMTCVVAGAVAMLSKKQPGRHLVAGRVYYWFLAVVFVTGVGLSIVRWAEDRDLFFLAILSFGLATFGREAMRRGRLGRFSPHIIGMGASYIVLLTAFYVDNGMNLPVWKDLPPLAYWTLPSLIGAPIMSWALLRHSLVHQHRPPPSKV